MTKSFAPEGRVRRIAYLRDKLTQMGHETSKRIEWENELEELLKQPEPAKPEVKRILPNKIKGGFKPKRCNHFVWNQKLLEGWKRTDTLILPIGYHREATRYVVPSYLQEAFGRFKRGKVVFGQKWEHLGLHWGTKKNRRRIRSDLEVCTKYVQHVDEFFSLAPCVPYYECRDRFPKDALEGNGKMQLTKEAGMELKRVRDEERRLKKEQEAKQAEEIRRELNFENAVKWANVYYRQGSSR